MAPIPHRGAIGSKCRTRPPLADLIGDLKVSDGLTPGGGRHHFFEATSLSMALSSITSASSFLSFAFSSSSAFSVAHYFWPEQSASLTHPAVLAGWIQKYDCCLF